jgi:hypothetical protein
VDFYALEVYACAAGSVGRAGVTPRDATHTLSGATAASQWFVST